MNMPNPLDRLKNGLLPDLADVPEISELREHMAAMREGIDTLIGIEHERLQLDRARALRDGIFPLEVSPWPNTG